MHDLTTFTDSSARGDIRLKAEGQWDNRSVMISTYCMGLGCRAFLGASSRSHCARCRCFRAYTDRQQRHGGEGCDGGNNAGCATMAGSMPVLARRDAGWLRLEGANWCRRGRDFAGAGAAVQLWEALCLIAGSPWQKGSTAPATPLWRPYVSMCDAG